MNLELFNTSVIEKTKGLLIMNHTLKVKRIGIEKIIINETFKFITIRVNSKILGSNYNKGICNITLEQFLDEINKSGIILDKFFIYDCKVKIVHIKNDIKLKMPTQEYVNALNNLLAIKFIKTKYESGIVFKGKIKINPSYLTAYEKWTEIHKHKEFLKVFPEMKNNFKGIMRIESKFQKISSITKYLGNNNFLDILNMENINYDLLRKIINNQTQFKNIIDTSMLTNNEEKTLFQIKCLSEKYNGDFNMIYNHIKSKLGKNTKSTYQRNQIIKYLSIINNSEINLFKELIDEVLISLNESNFHN